MDHTQKKESILEAFRFRHACKLFDSEKRIPEDDFNFILETGRLSPSSFGMQGWKFLVITDPNIRTKLKPACWNQNQIDSCSHLIVFLARTAVLEPYSDWVKARFDERDLPRDRIEGYYKRYANFHEENKSTLFEWAARQCYIPLTNMMTSAAMIGIDSCPMEGFEKESVEEILGIDPAVEEVVAMAAFGYRKNPAQRKIRLSLNEIVEWR